MDRIVTAGEFRTMTGGLPASQGTGEYGILPPSSGDGTGSSGRIGKLYSFHIPEFRLFLMAEPPSSLANRDYPSRSCKSAGQ